MLEMMIDIEVENQIKNEYSKPFNSSNVSLSLEAYRIKRIMNIYSDRFNTTDDEAITELYSKIKVMEDYGKKLEKADPQKGEIAINLARKLGWLVNSYEKKQIEEPKFKEEFNKLLHSQDHIMSKHRATWKPILVNIDIALTGVGLLAIGIKLAHDKLSTGQATFFYHKTYRQGQIEDIKRTFQSHYLAR